MRDIIPQADSAGSANVRSVDIKTDEIMQKVIREEFRDSTIISVAHRLDT